MTNQQILEKAIQKAIDSGWDNIDASPDLMAEEYGGIHGLIFNHDFAKALWGVDTWRYALKLARTSDGRKMKGNTYEGLVHEKPVWCHHLQEMVLADDPIKYLGENI